MVETVDFLPYMVETVDLLPYMVETVDFLPYMVETVDFLPYMVETVGKKEKKTAKHWRNEVDTKTVKVATSQRFISQY